MTSTLPRARHLPTAHRAAGTASGTRPGGPALDLVVPVHNEERDLEPCVTRLAAFLIDGFPWSARITVVDNASTDRTWEVARRLSEQVPGVTSVRLGRKGRGHALHEAWAASDAAVVAYTDVDLSTDLQALLPLVAPLLSGHSDVAIGTRLGRGARIVRGPKREVLSRGYNVILRAALGARFSDAQCGFKAVRADVARDLLPLVQDRGWFFDTELLVLAERAGLRVHEVPVDWVDDPDSRVALAATVVEDLRGVARLGTGLARGRIDLGPVSRHARPELVARDRGARPGAAGQLLRFAGIGAVSTLAYLLLYLALRGPLGPQAANASALLLTAVANTAVNRRVTFGVRGRAGSLGHQARGLVAFGVGLGLTSGSLAVLHALTRPGRPLELAVLLLASAGSTLVRFAVFRGWVFRTRPLPTAVPLAVPADRDRSAA